MDSGMTVYKTGKATIRIHGKADPDKVRAATERYVKRLIKEEMNHEEEQQEGTQPACG